MSCILKKNKKRCHPGENQKKLWSTHENNEIFLTIFRCEVQSLLHLSQEKNVIEWKFNKNCEK